MSRLGTKLVLWIGPGVFVAGCLLVPGLVAARATVYNAWDALYPASLSDDNVVNGTTKTCQLCHESSSGGDGWNGYGWQIRLGLDAGKTLDNAILDAEPFNSDAGTDGSLNLAEINGNTQPGWTTGSNTIYYKNSSPAAVSPPSGIGDLDPASTAVAERNLPPTRYGLSPCWPNPLRSSTTIAFDLPVREDVLLRVFDIRGRLIRTLVNQELGPGRYRVTWHGDLDGGQKAISGIYFYRMDTPGYRQTRKVIVL